MPAVANRLIPTPPEPSEGAVTLAAAQARFAEFNAAVAKAQSFHKRGKLELASVHAGIAAMIATSPHAGFYVSPRLERMLVDIGRRTAKPTTYRRQQSKPIRHVLHVVSEVLPVGGLTNMLTRWIAEDSTRTHSIAAIHHRGELPASTREAVAKTGGTIHRINQTPGFQTAWAEELRELARRHDAVVLSIYGQDPVAIMAFAEPNKLPPIMYLNHGDHLFWLGASIADVVMNMREEAQTLSIARRTIEPKRNIVVPTMVSPAVRTRSREDAKRELGMAPDTILLMSAARGMKYRTVNGVTFAAPHVGLLKKHPKAQLLVVGAGERPDWQADCAAVEGRIQPLPETSDTRIYFEAADIYVDSFPFVSSTSMMEAAGLETPLVSRFYGEPEARIFAINHPGIDKPTLHGASEHEYVSHLDRLISYPALREAKGKEARDAVQHYHTPPSWLTFIERAYSLAEQLPPIDPSAHFAPGDVEVFSHGEPDRSMYEVFGLNRESPVRMLRWYLGVMPVGDRFGTWLKILRAGAFNNAREAMRLLAPNWMVRRYSDRA
ncbi:MAG: glycosyl transferase family 1 [Hyphomonadaceae bacterium]